MSFWATPADRAGWLALFGLSFVLVLVPLAPGREVFAGVPLDKVILSVPIAILLAIPLLTKLGSLELPRVGIEVPAFLFLGWALVSAIFTGAQPEVLATWSRYAAYMVLVYVVATVAAEKTRLRVMSWILAIAGSMTVAYSFYQYMYPTEFLGMQGMGADVATRVFSTFGNPNFYAEYLVLLIAVTLALLFTERGPLRGLALLFVVAQVMALLLTYTRGSWIALAIGLAIALLIIDSRLVLPFAIGGGSMMLLFPGVAERMISLVALEGSAGFRLGLWRVAGDAIAERPLFGIGAGRFYDAFTSAVLTNPEHNVGFLFYGAHQSYFQLAAEIGIIGGLAFAWLVFKTCRMGAFYTVRMSGDTKARLFNAAMTAGLVAFALNAFTSNAFQHPQAAVFFFVLAGMQAGNGSRFWELAPKERVTHPNRDSLWGRSLLGRVHNAIDSVLNATWKASWISRMLAKEPLGGGRLLADAWVIRALIGEGTGASSDRTSRTDETLAPAK